MISKINEKLHRAEWKIFQHRKKCKFINYKLYNISPLINTLANDRVFIDQSFRYDSCYDDDRC